MINEQFEEGIRSLHLNEQKQTAPSADETNRKEKIDKKKLIVYSTIMNPKFDE